jgi:hypothetical protein
MASTATPEAQCILSGRCIHPLCRLRTLHASSLHPLRPLHSPLSVGSGPCMHPLCALDAASSPDAACIRSASSPDAACIRSDWLRPPTRTTLQTTQTPRAPPPDAAASALFTFGITNWAATASNASLSPPPASAALMSATRTQTGAYSHVHVHVKSKHVPQATRQARAVMSSHGEPRPDQRHPIQPRRAGLEGVGRYTCCPADRSCPAARTSRAHARGPRARSEGTSTVSLGGPASPPPATFWSPAKPCTLPRTVRREPVSTGW